tara:strand:- start:1438 stop:2871 length:1434 start_codon:yes stop_codon:yes gene_type:complete
MPSWKKIIVSGSNAVLNEITASGGFKGDGSGITNVTAASVTFANVSGKPTLISGSAQLATSISGSFTSVSSSLSSRLTIAESELGNTLISGSGQIATAISGAFTETSSSLASRITTNESLLNQSVKTDASPTFAGLTSNGNVSVTGDIEATGNVIAKNYIVSSSVTHMTQSFSSGSTIFGDDSQDTHQFTGSLTISGAFALNGESFSTAVSSSAAAAGFGTGGSGVSSYDDLTNVPSGIISSSNQLPTGLVSGSAQLSTSISGSLTSLSSSLAGRLTTAESELGNTLISSSAQIASQISGSSTNLSSSLTSRITTLEGTGTTQGVGQSDNVTFGRITTTSGPDVFGGNVTIGGNLTLQGSQSAAETLVIADQFGFFASGSKNANVDAGILVQSGSNGDTGSALYHDITTAENTNPNGGRWSVAKNVKADDTAVTPGAFVGTVTVGGDSSEPDEGDVQYGVGEMYITSDGEIYIYTGS